MCLPINNPVTPGIIIRLIYLIFCRILRADFRVNHLNAKKLFAKKKELSFNEDDTPIRAIVPYK